MTDLETLYQDWFEELQDMWISRICLKRGFLKFRKSLSIYIKQYHQIKKILSMFNLRVDLVVLIVCVVLVVVLLVIVIIIIVLDVLDALDVLAKTRSLYQVPKLSCAQMMSCYFGPFQTPTLPLVMLNHFCRNPHPPPQL